ncbi:MAG: kelch repeat-containing protein [Planctomycetota bacterium]
MFTNHQLPATTNLAANRLAASTAPNKTSPNKTSPNQPSSRLHKPLPESLTSFGAAVDDDQCFMIGGLGDGNQIETTVDVFDMTQRTWKTVASPATARVFPVVTTVGKKIYLFGGFSNEGGHFSKCESLEVYDSESDKWSMVETSIDGADGSMRMFNMAGRLLFFGVDREVENQARFVLYDPNPMQEPTKVAPMSFSGGFSRDGGDAEKNAKTNHKPPIPSPYPNSLSMIRHIILCTALTASLLPLMANSLSANDTTKSSSKQ